MPESILCILNQSNNFTQRLTLSAPIERDYVRILANREDLIKVSFIADSYVFDASTSALESGKGIALSGSKIAYKIVEKPFYNATVELVDKTNAEELQIVLYCF